MPTSKINYIFLFIYTFILLINIIWFFSFIHSFIITMNKSPKRFLLKADMNKETFILFYYCHSFIYLFIILFIILFYLFYYE